MGFERIKNSLSKVGDKLLNKAADAIDSVGEVIDGDKPRKKNKMNVDLSKVTPVENELTVNLTKGENVKLDAGLAEIVIGLEWDPQEGSGDFDADASVVMLDKDSKALDFIYFQQLTSKDGSIVHTGDNLTGEDTDEADDESIIIDLTKVPEACTRIVFLAEIFQANQRGQSFGQVSKCGVRVYDGAGTNQVFAKHDLTEDHAGAVAINVGEVYKHNDSWKFKAIGTDNKTGIKEFLKDYGINS